MSAVTLPEAIQNILDTYSQPDAVFTALLPVLGEVLQCDRCFLYLRNPQTRLGQVPYCWRRNQDIPEIIDPDCKPEPESLSEEDPLFAAALRTDPSIYVEDVETASPEVVNREFERKEFGHQALIHSHLVWNGQLWGILQPCVFGSKRVWSAFDRAVVTQVEGKIALLAVAYVKAANF
ncbi:GAF domain-containing protein [Mastigocladopsis repens]|uniref:GAF domain-containing protein n=1 Tax=Mastigocladopsis repens TaxID=221287 RepID=UPI00030A94BB|nr:GAF domain-containing protein [Mastigocladopsis repens]